MYTNLPSNSDVCAKLPDIEYIYTYVDENIDSTGWYIEPNFEYEMFYYNEFTQIYQWCSNNITGPWELGRYQLYIKNDDDLILFKLSI